VEHIRAVIITISDACSRGEREDLSGQVLFELLKEFGATILDRKVLSDDLDPIVESLSQFARRQDVNLILTTGGTGLGPRDNTPEATRRVIEKEAQGLSEAMRAGTLEKTPLAMISRGVSGVCSGALIINLPGSPKAVRESFAVIKPVLAHAIDLLEGRTAHKA
jgi:molybdenum cofactor synthesis domain-containing protein